MTTEEPTEPHSPTDLLAAKIGTAMLRLTLFLTVGAVVTVTLFSWLAWRSYEGQQRGYDLTEKFAELEAANKVTIAEIKCATARQERISVIFSEMITPALLVQMDNPTVSEERREQMQATLDDLDDYREQVAANKFVC